MTTYQRVPVFSLKLVRERSVKYRLPCIQGEREASQALVSFLHDKDCEHLAVLLLDGQNNFLGIHDVAIGGLSRSGASVRDIFKAAIVARASGVVLGHNHPSGDVNPSEDDIVFTRKMVAASFILDIPVLDHVIVSSGIHDRCYSFLDHHILR